MTYHLTSADNAERLDLGGTLAGSGAEAARLARSVQCVHAKQRAGHFFQM